MALVGNHSSLNKTPGRYIGTYPGDQRGNFSKSSHARARFTGFAGYGAKSATPNGHLPSSSWVLPIKAGGMSAYTTIVGTGTITGANLAGGINISADLVGVGVISNALGKLVASASANLSGSGTITGANAKAFLNAVAALSGSGTITSATLRAPGRMTADLAGLGTLAATVKALGNMSADLTLAGAGVLTTDQIARAVWDIAAAEVNSTGTTGEALNLALKILRNKVITDPSTGTYTVYDDDGTTVLLEGDFFEDVAGATPYAGNGADRRDRLV